MSDSRLQWACERENTLLRHMEVALAQERAHSAELLEALQAEKAQRRLRESDLLVQLKAAVVVPKGPTPRRASPPRPHPTPEQQAIKASPVRVPAAPTSECIGCRAEIPRLRGRIAELSKKLSEAKMKQPPSHEISTVPTHGEEQKCDTSRVAAFLRELLIAAMDEDPTRCHDAMQRRCVPALKAMIPSGDDTATRHMSQLCDVIVRLRQRANRDVDFPADVSAVYTSSMYQTLEPESVHTSMYRSGARATDLSSYVQSVEPESVLVAHLQPDSILSPARSEDVMSMSRLLNVSSGDPASTRTAGGERSPPRQNEMTYDEWKKQFLAGIADGCDE